MELKARGLKNRGHRVCCRFEKLDEQGSLLRVQINWKKEEEGALFSV